MKKIRTVLIIVLSLIALYTIIGFFILPPVLTSVLSKSLTQALHRNTTVEKIRMNPYTLTVEVQGLTIKDQNRPGSFVSFRSLFIDLEWASIIKRAPVIREVKLEKPYVKIIRFENGTYNFSDLMKGGTKKEKPQEFSVSNVQVISGRVEMDDRPVHKTNIAKDITLTIPFLSNIPYYTDVFVQPRFQADINGTPFTLQGKTKPFSDSLETTVSLDLKDINLPYYLAYLPMKLGVQVDSGSLDIDSTISFKQFRKKQQPILNITGSLVCKNIDVKDLGGDTILHLPQLSVVLAPSLVLKKKVHIAQIAFLSPELNLSRDKKGVLNLAQAVQKTKNSAPTASPETTSQESPLELMIDRIDLSTGKVSYTDLSGNSPVRIKAEDMTIAARRITTDKQGGGTMDVTCTLNRTGHLYLGTSFTMKPVSADISLEIEGFQPSWVQPYVLNQVPILIRQGKLSTKGQMKLALASEEPPRIGFRGDVQFTGLATVDKIHGEDLVSWKDLSASGIDFSLNPTRLSIREIGFISPSASLIINPDGNTNVGALSHEKPSKSSPPPAKRKKTSAHISVGKITFKNGRFTFADRSISPRYTTSVTGISGNISGLSSDEFKKANVAMKAKLDNQAPISITGSVNPLKQDLFVNLAVSFDNIELTPMTPYSDKYLGYAIDKGKLSLGLKYSIDKKVLQAQNDVLIDQLTFGRTVDSKDATKLPVKLAVVLLRDNSGKIDLHLPITGRTDDPDFHIGKIIIHTLVNILEKAATSPFTLLASLYPGAEELNSIAFEPGKSTLSEGARKKLDEVAKILTDRTPLKLEISGYADASSDKPGLVTYLFDHKLKEQKLKDILSQGKQAPSVDDIIIEQSEYGNYLKKAYKAFNFPGKPKNFLGLDKSLPDDEMKNLMTPNIKVTDDDLKSLAEERSQRVRDYLVDTEKIDGGRIFLVKADALSPEKTDKTGNARVNLSIK
ncbi:MAG TPA: DUF748 domain-containing protein [Desulfomonilia bacterium]|nr:DUF748 domain-containing protein [Desulfomonilia bacterium]